MSRCDRTAAATAFTSSGITYGLPDRAALAYQVESGTRRLFCRTCGATMISEADAWEAVYFSAGTLDTPLDQKPTYHIWVRSKAPWYEILDELPQHATNPDNEG